MKLLTCLFLWGFTVTMGLSQATDQGKTSKQVEVLISKLYNEVIARHPIGIPWGKDWNIFAPYLSKELRHKFDLAIACSSDWDRKNPDAKLKPPIGWHGLGIFSGGEERAVPTAFKIEKTQLEKDGSFHVYMKLTWYKPPAPIWIWPVAAVVVQENDRFVINDIILLKYEDQEVDAQLSKILLLGCDGPHWVGFSKQNNRH